MAEPPKTSAGPLIGGIVAGLVAGSTVFTLVVFFIMAGLVSSLHATQLWPVFAAGYLAAAAMGVWGFVVGRVHSNFWTGFLIASAIGMLGGTAVCNVLISGLAGNGGMR